MNMPGHNGLFEGLLALFEQADRSTRDHPNVVALIAVLAVLGLVVVCLILAVRA